MNKTVTINISGIIFNIDEGAYDKLQKYLESIKIKFGTTQGGEEILTDIEARIAEMFHEKVNDQKQVISQIDVDEVIAIMGQPEQFEDSESQSETNSNTNSSYQEEPRKGPKRFFRDPDSKVLGGVCAGIGHFFGIDPVIIRLIFVAIVFFGGSGVILYLILWAIAPEAKTTTEKLQMKGQKIDIDSIRQTVSEEAENLKKKFDHLGNKADEFGKSINDSKVEGFFKTFFSFIFNLIKLLLTFVGKFLGILLIVFGGLFLISLIATLFGLSTLSGIVNIGGVNAFMFSDLYYFLFPDGSYSIAIAAGVALVAGIPIVSMLYGGIKILFNLKGRPRHVMSAATLLWVCGIVTLFISGSLIVKEFSKEDKVVSAFNLSPTLTDTIYIETNNDLFPIDAKPFHHNDKQFILKSYENELFLTDVELEVVKHQQDSIRVTVVQSARGTDYSSAVERAENIEYTYSIKDNRLIFEPYLVVRKEDLYRSQKVKIIVSIPEGKTVFLDETSGWIIYDIKNVTSTRDRYMTGKFWTMTADGLDCLHLDMSRDGIRSRRKARNAKKSRKPVVPKQIKNEQVVKDSTVTAAIIEHSSDPYLVFPSPFNVIG